MSALQVEQLFQCVWSCCQLIIKTDFYRWPQNGTSEKVRESKKKKKKRKKEKVFLSSFFFFLLKIITIPLWAVVECRRWAVVASVSSSVFRSLLGQKVIIWIKWGRFVYFSFCFFSIHFFGFDFLVLFHRYFYCFNYLIFFWCFEKKKGFFCL